MKIIGVIPARYGSTRFPGKPLHKIAGKPLIQWVVEQCQKAKSLSKVVVATDDTQIWEVAQELSRRLSHIFLRNGNERPVFGDYRKLQDNPHFRDHLLFYEYFHGDNGSGVGASHQTGWTGLIAKLLQQAGRTDSE